MDRSWMYIRKNKDRCLNPVFVEKLDEFIIFACAQPSFMNGSMIRCPCKLCKNKQFHEPNEVRLHLLKKGFIADYLLWTCHGEPFVSRSSAYPTYYEPGGTSSQYDFVPSWEPHNTIPHTFEPLADNPYRTMVMNAAGPNFDPNNSAECPNPSAENYQNMLRASEQPLWPGCETMTQLGMTARLLNLKAEHHFSERLYDGFCSVMQDALPEDNTMPKSFYETKKLVSKLELPVEKIHCCVNGCMIYWGVDNELRNCKFCNKPRFEMKKKGAFGRPKEKPVKKMYYFPIAPRLQRLYASEATAKHMRWHAEHEQEEGVMRHSSDSYAWKYFNNIHPTFSAETRNVRLGLCTDGFQTFGISGEPYSSWPVIVTPYNLPPWMCMKDEFMFLSIIVPGPKNPTQRIDVYLQPFIAEMQMLWDTGVLTWDISKKQNFKMRVALMWTVSDFPAYSMLSGWSTHGKLACPYCMENSDAFQLKNGGKPCWFDCHRKFLPQGHPYRKNKNKFIKDRIVDDYAPIIRSGEEILQHIDYLGIKRITEIGAEKWNEKICDNMGTAWKKRSLFWDLEYWKTNIIRHNIDVMHTEKNVFMNVFNTVMAIDGKTKDNAKAREDMKLLCRRKKLQFNPKTQKYPKAVYSLEKEGKQAVCKWVKELKFPDGYVSNLGRCVDMKKHKLNGSMKSHDCHVFMQRLIPIAFRELLPNDVWEALAELSLFFKTLTSATIKVEDMDKLILQIPIILCKIEMIFPPGFWDSMEHLVIHLAYEARVGGPVQSRWMYPFERQMGRFKKNVRNYARVEGSLCNAYLNEESTSFCSHYFEPHVPTRHRKVPRNDAGAHGVILEGNLKIFSQIGRTYGKSKKRPFDDINEYVEAHRYILLNCPEIQEYVDIFTSYVRDTIYGINDEEVDLACENDFPTWFKNFAPDNIENEFIKDLAKGPINRVISVPVYFVNGFKFHTMAFGSNNSTDCSAVCIRGKNYSETESDYYGRISDILIVEYPRLPIKRVVLFKCDWFDPTPKIGTRIHPRLGLVEVHRNKRLAKYEPFILASQAGQVSFIPYPSIEENGKFSDWLVVCNIKARAMIEVASITDNPIIEQPAGAFQDDESNLHGFFIDLVGEGITIGLNDPSGLFVDLPVGEVESEEEIEYESEPEVNYGRYDDFGV